MDRSTVITLIKVDYEADTIGNLTPVESRREVFCNRASVGQSEFFKAGEVGLKAELKVTMFEPDYEGETLAEINNIRYSVYRTFVRADELIELYLERKVGV